MRPKFKACCQGIEEAITRDALNLGYDRLELEKGYEVDDGDGYKDYMTVFIKQITFCPFCGARIVFEEVPDAK